MASHLRTLRPFLLHLHQSSSASSRSNTLFLRKSIPKRTFRSSAPFLLADSPPITAITTANTPAAASTPVRKPVGAFRSGVFGFLLGSTLAGAATWFYIMEEYRVSNELLTEDIYALQAAVQRIHTLVQALEERLALAEMKGGEQK